MLAIVYSLMIGFSFLCAMFTGSFDKISGGFITSLSEAIEFCIKLSGIMCFWSGFMSVLKKCGYVEKMTKIIRPLLQFVYGERAKEKEVALNLASSLSANMLGLGNAALPFGIAAVKSLEKDNKTGIACDETIMFCVLNTVPFQLIPATLVAMRQNYGSADAFDVVPVIWISLLLNNAFAILLCKIFSKLSRRKP